MDHKSTFAWRFVFPAAWSLNKSSEFKKLSNKRLWQMQFPIRELNDLAAFKVELPCPQKEAGLEKLRRSRAGISARAAGVGPVLLPNPASCARNMTCSVPSAL